MDSFDQLMNDLNTASRNLSDAADNLRAARLYIFGDTENAQPTTPQDQTPAPVAPAIISRIKASISTNYAHTTARHDPGETESTDDL